MKILEAIGIVNEFNNKDFDSIYWNEYFEGEELEKCLNDFKFTGLNNTDLITSNFIRSYPSVKLK